MKFVIDRWRWRCGGESQTAHGRGKTLLCNPDGFMCCLGFVERQLRGDMNLSVAAPSELPYLSTDFLQMEDDFVDDEDDNVYAAVSPLAEQAMFINDCGYDRDVREQKLVALFAKHGHELEFTGAYKHPYHEEVH